MLFIFCSELKASLVAMNAKDDEPLKQQNAHLQEQVNELQIKIQKAKEVNHKFLYQRKAVNDLQLLIFI
jgi:hypothetical protein